MKKTHLVLASLLLAAPLAAVAGNPVKMTFAEANSLFGALTKIQNGLTPDNTVVAARDIWALKEVAEIYGKEQIAVGNRSNRIDAVMRQHADAKVDVGADLDAKDAVQAKWTAFLSSDAKDHSGSFPVLEPLAISTDEIKDMKITPDTLAPILQFLSPPRK